MRDYFKKKSDAIDGKKEGRSKKKICSKYYEFWLLNLFFGSNTIDVKSQVL
jgi:hypothetical protein